MPRPAGHAAELLLLCLGLGTVAAAALRPSAGRAAAACWWRHARLACWPGVRFPATAQPAAPLRLRGGGPAEQSRRKGRLARSTVGDDQSGHGRDRQAPRAAESARDCDHRELHDELPRNFERELVKSSLAPPWTRRHESYDAIVHVDAARGDDDGGDGSSTAPFASIFTALSRAVTTHRNASVLLNPGSLYSGHRYAAGGGVHRPCMLQCAHSVTCPSPSPHCAPSISPVPAHTIAREAETGVSIRI